jgi:ATP-dependent RNA helicase RhlE
MEGSWTLLADGRLACAGGNIKDNYDAQKGVYIFTPPTAGAATDGAAYGVHVYKTDGSADTYVDSELESITTYEEQFDERIAQEIPVEYLSKMSAYMPIYAGSTPPSIEGTVATMLQDPARVEIARVGETADTVEERLCPVTQGQKTELLQAILAADQPERLLVFCRTKRRVDEVAESLARAQVKVGVMHADKQQRQREKALEDFRSAKLQVLVATDVMSRGIDVSGIDAVVNYDVPMDPEDYVHRIGRTGRAGHAGLAYTFVAPDEITQLREVEYFTKKRVPTWDLPGFTYDQGRIVPNEQRATSRASRTMFSGSRSRGRGPAGGRYGRHY